MTSRSYKRLEWAMRVVAFLCIFVQANVVLFDASWQRSSWLYTTAAGALALLVAAWFRRQRRALPEEGSSPPEVRERAWRSG
jgi:uncharacterized membrane protein YcjF (UPF0283 family)